jgi:hypothetical protein
MVAQFMHFLHKSTQQLQVELCSSHSSLVLSLSLISSLLEHPYTILTNFYTFSTNLPNRSNLNCFLTLTIIFFFPSHSFLLCWNNLTLFYPTIMRVLPKCWNCLFLLSLHSSYFFVSNTLPWDPPHLSLFFPLFLFILLFYCFYVSSSLYLLFSISSCE